MATDTETLYPFSGVDTQRITEAGFEIPRQNGDSATFTYEELSEEWKLSRGSLSLKGENVFAASYGSFNTSTGTMTKNEITGIGGAADLYVDSNNSGEDNNIVIVGESENVTFDANETVVIGDYAGNVMDTGNAGSVIIGKDAARDGLTTTTYSDGDFEDAKTGQNVVIGEEALAYADHANHSVFIGPKSGLRYDHGDGHSWNMIGIGQSTWKDGTAHQSIAIGTASGRSMNGTNAILMGAWAAGSAEYDYSPNQKDNITASILLGSQSYATKDNQLVVGSSADFGSTQNNKLDEGYFGQGVETKNPQPFRFRTTDAHPEETNLSGSDLGITPGRGTGNGTSSAIFMETPEPTTSGTDFQDLFERFRLDHNTATFKRVEFELQSFNSSTGQLETVFKVDETGSIVEGSVSVDGSNLDAAGPDNSIQFNDNNNFSGSSDLIWDGAKLNVNGEIDVDLLSIKSNTYSNGYEFTEDIVNDELVLTGPTGAELMRQPVNGPTKFVQGLDLAFPIESISDAEVTFVDANITSNSSVGEEVGYTFDVDNKSILGVVGRSDGDKIQDKLFRVFGSIKQSSGSLVTLNDNGEINYSLNQKTNGGIAKVLKIDSQGFSSKPTLPDEGTWHFEGNVTARVVSANSSLSDAEKGDSHVWRIEGVISQTIDNPSLGSTNARFIGTPSVTTVANDVSVNNYSVDVFINGDGELEINVQGGTGDEVHWVGNLEVDEIVG